MSDTRYVFPFGRPVKPARPDSARPRPFTRLEMRGSSCTVLYRTFAHTSWTYHHRT
jgi:hypothetical protein